MDIVVGVGETEHRGGEDQVFARRQVVVQARRVREKPDAVPHGVGLTHDVVTRDRRAAAIRAEQRRQHPQERALTAAVRAEQPDDFAGCDGDRRAAKHPSRAEAAGDVSSVEQCV